jgi:hypothetical protein
LEDLRETMRNFDAGKVDQDTACFISGTIKKYGLSLKNKDSKVPEEFALVTKWLLTAEITINYLSTSQSVLKKLVDLNLQLNQAYIEKLALTDQIKEAEKRINGLLEAIELCERTGKDLKHLKNNESFELDIITAELFNCEIIIKKCTGQKEVAFDDSPASIIVDSLFVSQSYSPEPKLIEFKAYTEDSFLELPTQRANPVSSNTLENTYSEIIELKKPEPKPKKKCCGLIS